MMVDRPSTDVVDANYVAQLLDCEVSTVEEKARNNQLPAIKIGRSWVFPYQALIGHLNYAAHQHAKKPADGTLPAALERSKGALVAFDSVRGRKAKEPPALPSL